MGRSRMGDWTNPRDTHDTARKRPALSLGSHLEYTPSMPLHPQARTLLDRIADIGEPDLSTLSIEQARALSAKRKRLPGPPARTQDLSIPGAGGEIPMRVYYPEQSGPLPAVVYFHGGGFAMGSIEGHDGLCRTLAVETGCCVASVGYRLAPEHPFPAATLDAYTALCWVHENADELGVDHRRLAIAGDSAGGTLATVAARQAMERRGPPLAMQLLLYPVTDLRTLDTPSYHELSEGHFVSRTEMAWFRDMYLPDETRRSDPSASPLASDALTGLPRTLVVTAEYDPLRDEGRAYADKLTASGVETTYRCYPGMIHGFISLAPYLDDGRRALSECAAELRQALGIPNAS